MKAGAVTSSGAGSGMAMATNEKCHMAMPYHKNDKMPVSSGPSVPFWRLTDWPEWHFQLSLLTEKVTDTDSALSASN